LRRIDSLALFVALMLAGGCKPQTAEPDPPPPDKPKVAQAPPAADPSPKDPSPVEASGPPRPKTPASFAAAEEAARAVWADTARTFFCECEYTPDNHVSHARCGYEPRADIETARTMRWTHVVPPQELGGTRPCWTRSSCTTADGRAVMGVECCIATDPEFLAMYTDLFNLVPAVEEIVHDRAGYPFAEIEGEQRMYGRCDFEVDEGESEVEPPDDVRGDVARIYLYMDRTYPDALALTPLQRRRFEQWTEADPPDDPERQRAAAIAERQGLPNPW
jgi:deoxyribonuclease-1